MRLALMLSLVCLGALAADPLTWKEANHKSAEALKAEDYKAGAAFARTAFEAYATQADPYLPSEHAQLLVNLADAEKKAENNKAAIRAMETGIAAIQAKTGDDAAVVNLWQEAAALARYSSIQGRSDECYAAAVALAVKLWGKDDARTARVHKNWVNLLYQRHTYAWSAAKLDAAREIAARASGNEALVLAIDLTRARVDVESKKPERAARLYVTILDRLKAGNYPKEQVQDIYAALEYAYEAAGDHEAAATTHQQLLASLANDQTELVPLVRVQPQYPPQAARKGINGKVQIEITINPDGTVKDAHVLESEPRYIFDDVALDAIRKWKFRPRVRDGQAVEGKGTQVLRFEMMR